MRFGWLVLAGLLAAMPVAGQVIVDGGTVEPLVVDTTLYLHPLNGGRDMPINTQVPQLQYADLPGVDGSTPTLTCLDPTTNPVTHGLTSQDFTVWRGFSSPSFVEYEFPNLNGEPRVHSERMLGHDIRFADDSTPTLVWSLAAVPVAGGLVEVPVVPQVVVKAEVLEPDALSLDDRGYDRGAHVLQGETLPVTLAAGTVLGDGAAQVVAEQIAGQWVYTFRVPLDVVKESIWRQAGFNLRIDLVLQTPSGVCKEGKLALPGLVPFADEQHLSHLEVRNERPLLVSYAYAMREQGGEGDLVELGWAVYSGWGPYDVLANETTLTIDGPSRVRPNLVETLQRISEHGHFSEPVTQAWTLDPEDLATGSYTAHWSVPNLQRTAIASTNLTFFIADGQLVKEPQAPKQMPSLTPAALFGALSLATLLVRRR